MPWCDRPDPAQPAAAPACSGTFRRFMPNYALIFFGDRRHTLVNEFLHALAAVGLGGEDVALGIRGNAMHRIEFAGLASAIAEAGQNFQSVAKHDVDLF